MEIARRAAAFLLLALLVGCSGIESEPETAFAPIPPQSYPFDVVWECLIEAAEDLEFTVIDSERDGERGHFSTGVTRTFSDSLQDLEEGQRFSARINPQEAEVFAVDLAASKFRRVDGGAWTYVEPDSALRTRFLEALHASVTRRYRTQSADEGY